MDAMLWALVLLVVASIGGGANALKLNGNVIPYRYDVEIDINVFSAPEFVYGVSERIALGIVEDTEEINLHFHRVLQKVANIRLIGENGVEFAPRYEVFHYGEMRVTLGFMATIPGGRNYTLHIPKISGRDAQGGITRVPLQDASSHLWITSRNNTAARSLFPVFDEPQYSAIFALTFYSPDGLTVIGNTPISSRLGPIPEHNNMIQTKLEEVYLPPHALGFVLTDQPSITSPDARIRLFYPAYRSQRNADVVMELFNRALLHLERSLNVATDTKKVDVVAVPGFVGTVTKWGLIFIDDQHLGVDNTDAFVVAQDQQMNDINCALSEMWIGHMISADWWTHVWLTRGLSRYLCSYVHNHRGARGNIQFVVETVQRALREDSQSNPPLTTDLTWASNVAINHPTEVVVDQKAASIFRMIANLIGQDNFNAVVAQLIAQNKFGSINPAQVYAVIEQYSNGVVLPAGLSVSDVFRSWESSAGYPIVNVERAEQGFRISRRTRPPVHVPITYVTPGGDPNQTNVTHWLEKDGSSVLHLNDMSADWIVLNNWQTGFYRVSYDEPLWAQLTDQLFAGPLALSTANRAQLIDDSANLAADQEIRYSIFFDLVRYMVNETDSIPWRVAETALTALDVKLRGLKHYEKYHQLLLSLTEEQYLINRIRQPVGMDNFERMMAVSSIACLAGHETCVKDAEHHFNNSLSDGPAVHGSAEFQYLIYCTLTMHSRFYNYLHILLADRNSDTAAHAIRGLGCSHDAKMIDQLYRMSSFTTVNGSIITLSVTERTNIFRALIQGTSTSTTIGLHYVLEEFLVLADRYTSVEALFENVGTFLVVDEQVELMQTIYDHYKDRMTPSVLRTVARELRIAQHNLLWLGAVQSDINSWLESNFPGAASSIQIAFVNILVSIAIYLLVAN